jgi:hypothetical protein
MFFNLFSGVPIARDIANVADRKASGQFVEYTATPVARAVKSGEALASDLWAVSFGDGDPSDKWLRHIIETPGYFTGLPTGQASATTQFLFDVMNENQTPESVADWYVGLTKGKVPDK